MSFVLVRMKELSTTRWWKAVCGPALAVAVSLAFYAAPLAAQGSIGGRVIDQDGAALRNASVLVVGTNVGGMTNQEGRFSIGGLTPGEEVRLRITLIGYASETITGRVGDTTLALGNQALLGELGVQADALEERAVAERGEGHTVVFLVVDGRVRALLAVADPIKESTPGVIRALQDEGLEIVLLTGDNRTAAEAVARTLGITNVEAEVLPEGKAEVIRRLQGEGGHRAKVAMAGDGINDAPALAAADVGIAMGTGTDVAMQSAGITLVKGDLNGIVRARRLSRATLRNIRQNLFWAFFYNALGIPLAAGVLYPWLGWLLSPMIAAAAMSLSSVTVISNALRLRNAA